jgi:hypothetical protein
MVEGRKRWVYVGITLKCQVPGSSLGIRLREPGARAGASGNSSRQAEKTVAPIALAVADHSGPSGGKAAGGWNAPPGAGWRGGEPK